MTTNYADMPGVAAPLLPRDELSLGLEDLSDRGNAARFVARHGERFLFVRALGWLTYTGSHWTREGVEAAILNAALDTVAAMEGQVIALYQAAKLNESQGDEKALKAAARMKAHAGDLRDWMTTSGSISRLRGMLAVAEARLPANLDDFDRDPLAFNVKNGTIRFVKGEQSGGVQLWNVRLDKHDPADRISRISPFDYKPDAKAPLWEAHLKRCMPEFRERGFLLRQLGYALIGHRTEQVFLLWQGRGGDGKSVTANTTRRVMGSYAATADVKTFLEDKSGRSAAAASPDLARLAGATRFVSVSEPPRGSKLNEGLIKQFTGGAPLTARHLNKDLFEFIPVGLLVLECNARPAIGGSDDGIWRRVVLLLWREQLKRAEMDPQLEDKLVGEGEGVLAALVDGACRYLERGLDPPETVEAAHADYKRGSNAFREWLETHCERDDAAVVRIDVLYQSYKDAMEAQGFEPVHVKTFGLALSDHQIMVTSREPRSGKGRRKGVRLLSLDEIETRRAAADAVATAGAPSPCLTPSPSASPQAGVEGARREPADVSEADAWVYDGE